MDELLRRWTLEVAEFTVFKTFYVALQNFEIAKEYRDKEKELQKRIDDLSSVIKQTQKNTNNEKEI